MPESPDIGQISDEWISEFQISGPSLIKENCHNSTSSNDIDMKLGPATKLNKRNKTTSKKIGDGVISVNVEAIVIFPIYGRFGAIRKRDSGHLICKIKSLTLSL